MAGKWLDPVLHSVRAKGETHVCCVQASKSDHELSAELFDKLPSWLERGTLKPSHPRLRQGLDSVPEGFQEYRDGKISGYKIVYALD